MWVRAGAFVHAHGAMFVIGVALATGSMARSRDAARGRFRDGARA